MVGSRQDLLPGKYHCCPYSLETLHRTTFDNPISCLLKELNIPPYVNAYILPAIGLNTPISCLLKGRKKKLLWDSMHISVEGFAMSPNTCTNIVPSNKSSRARLAGPHVTLVMSLLFAMKVV